jgi:glycosyltransferase involved in cell wall biosynthesis
MKPTHPGNPKSPASPRCSIIIRAYNEEGHIGRLLAGIMQQTVKDVEIILVDSGSTDATTAIAGRYPVSILHIPPEEFTFGRSLNQGIRQANGEIIVIASAHIYPVFPDWLEKLLEPFENPETAIAYGKQRGAENTKFSESRVFEQWFPDQSQKHQSHPFCNNANAAIRRSVWQKNKYDESLTGLEDLAWASWAVDQGHLIAYIAEAEVVHVHDETPAGVYNRYRREALAFKRIFPQERFSLINFFHLTITNITSDLAQAARQGLLWPNLSSIFWFRIMQFWGTYQGYRHSGPVTWQLRRTFYYPRRDNHQTGTRPRDVEPIHYNE